MGIMRGEEEILTERRKEGVTHVTWEQGGQWKEGTGGGGMMRTQHNEIHNDNATLYSKRVSTLKN